MSWLERRSRNCGGVICLALTFVRDTLEGKPTRALELSGPEGDYIDLVAHMLERKRRFEEAEEAQK